MPLQAKATLGRMQGRDTGKRRRGNGGLRRAIRYLGNQQRTTVIAYGALVIATLAQLAVPELIQRMINTITEGVIANTVFRLPTFAQEFAATQAGFAVDDLRIVQANAESWLLQAALVIIVFAATRGIFAFIQTFMAEQTSQGIAFDMRNQIFAKIQRLSFSYHDRNQTGQLMIRATDDVEKVRLFIAQGLVLAAQAFLLLVVTLIILFATNWQLTLLVMPILPIALVVFTVFGALSQPLFVGIQKRYPT